VAQTPSAKRLTPASNPDADIARRGHGFARLFAAVWLLVSAAMVGSGVDWRAATLSQGRAAAILLAVVGKALTPTLLWFFHIRKRIWDKSSRVLALLGQVRAP